MTMLRPGSTIGIIGAGQLGRMLGVAAAQLGYRIHVFAPASGPACDVNNAFTAAAYDDEAALAEFAKSVDVVTYEFENIDAAPIARLVELVPVRPSAKALAIAQNRIEEKTFVENLGGRAAPWRAVNSREELDAAIAEIGCPAILKTVRFGYDGKGQARLASTGDADAAWDAIGGNPAILEGFVTFDHEFSIVLARGQDGAHVSYPPPLNGHEDGILARSTVPAPAEVASQWTEAAALAGRVADALDYVGVLTLEFFAGKDGPIFNEMAPRVHNSGHWTIEGAVTSQFENHIRAICGLPLGSTAVTGTRVEMENLIGEQARRWSDIIAEPEAHLHLYGKAEIRPGRKMGHVTRVWR
ncbi:5-(carboxyamino)imidazole ribonucleotide synthase [Stakelama pacifica]|uniref:N5-carboxyaminoimidazole ribonucleotide synthase n=1 Tax=Stakelama pacifica TaxID=517720 RepID=A0A4R6FFT5_9SPHN|nr:5-(carboxyamino)imidazole ribonucleotide synthase [Stakelama pacifica]TDN79255.1 5-(carboxyamino)imidazole ribonucleotide synthase [Stakelama pacifica]GGO98597.1 N5-carboxyaminoimidazole ribonucleotide synthase [Stakelama pacifica]